MTVIGILLSTPILLLGVLSGVGVVFAMVEGNVAWLLTDVALAVGLIWLGGSVMIQCVLGVLEVRTETAPRGFPVLPHTPDPPLPTGATTRDELSGDASIEDPMGSGERAT